MKYININFSVGGGWGLAAGHYRSLFLLNALKVVEVLKIGINGVYINA